MIASIRGFGIAELERATDELRPAGEGARVDERLVVPLLDVQVADVDDDGTHGEEHRKEQAEEHGDLTAVVADAAATPPGAPFPLHPSSPGRIHAHSGPVSSELEAANAEPLPARSSVELHWLAEDAARELPNLPLEDASSLSTCTPSAVHRSTRRTAWLERYLTDGSPRLQHFAEITALASASAR